MPNRLFYAGRLRDGIGSDRRPSPQPMRPPMRRQQTTHSAPRMDAPTWYAGDMRRANRPAARGGKRKRQADDSEEEHVVVVPPSCYNGSLPKRRGSMYYCEAHALRERASAPCVNKELFLRNSPVSRPFLPKLEAAVWVALLATLSHGRRPP